MWESLLSVCQAVCPVVLGRSTLSPHETIGLAHVWTCPEPLSQATSAIDIAAEFCP